MGKIEESGAQGVGGNTVDNYTWVDIPLNSLMTEFFEGSDTDELIQHMFVHIKIQVENS